MVTDVLPPATLIVPAATVAVNAEGSVTVTVVVALAPFASVTVYEYVPDDTVKVPVPVYGATPPLALTVTVVVPPLQLIVPAVDVADNEVGCAMVILCVAEHPFASFSATA